MSEIIEFPPVPRKVDDVNERHAKAFRDLESDISDCVRMSEIAAKVMPDETDEYLMFAVHQAVTMLQQLQKRYYALWEGEEIAE